MKILTFIFFLSMSYCTLAQQAMFVRVYDLTGNKIGKGRIVKISDSSLQLEGDATNFQLRNIGSIKTKRSGGNNVLTGSLIGMVTMAAIGAATSDPDASFFAYGAGEGAAAGAAFGIPIGAAIGGLTIAFKGSRTYDINGDASKWRAFQSMLQGK